MPISSSTIRLLRFGFSLFLAPVFLFALAETQPADPLKAALAFVVLHGFLYPASNGYNSFMDRDEGPVGGLRHPPMPTRQLYLAANLMDTAGILLSLLISPSFAAGMLAYVMASRAYSHRGIRLKRHPWKGYLTVVFFQGAWTFALASHACSPEGAFPHNWLPAAAASALIGGFYPLTQVYQHASDARDGVRTVSMLLGKRGTFAWSAGMFGLSFVLLGTHYLTTRRPANLAILTAAMLPATLYFTQWALQVWKDGTKADFTRTMRMNTIGAASASAAFIMQTLYRHLD